MTSGRMALSVALAVTTALISSHQAHAQHDISAAHCREGDVLPPPMALEAACTMRLAQGGLTPDERVSAIYLRGYDKIRQSEYRDAIADLDEGLKLAPNHSRMHRQRAYSAYRLRDYSAAVHHVRRSIELYSEGPAAHVLLADIANAMGDQATAFASYEAAIGLDVDQSYARLRRAQMNSTAGRQVEALKDTSWLMAQPRGVIANGGKAGHYGSIAYPLDVTTRLVHADVLARIDRRDEADAVMAAIVAERPTGEMYAQRAFYFHLLPSGPQRPARNDEAIADAMQAVLLAPDYYFGWHVLAISLQRKGQHAEALTALDESIELGGWTLGSPDQLWRRSRILQDLGKREEAIEYGVLAFDVSFRGSRSHVALLMQALVLRGYWLQKTLPSAMTEDLRDAITACRSDPLCR